MIFQSMKVIDLFYQYIIAPTSPLSSYYPSPGPSASRDPALPSSSHTFPHEVRALWAKGMCQEFIITPDPQILRKFQMAPATFRTLRGPLCILWRQLQAFTNFTDHSRSSCYGDWVLNTCGKVWLSIYTCSKASQLGRGFYLEFHQLYKVKVNFNLKLIS